MAQNPSKQEQIKLAAQFFRAGKRADAEQIYRGILAEDPTHADALVMLGIIACQTGRMTEGIALMRRATEARPGWAEGWNNLAQALQMSGALTEAVETYRRTLAIQPTHLAAMCNMGIALFHLQRFAEAREQFETVVKLKPDAADAHVGLGNVFAQDERLEDAVRHFQRAIELQPNNFVAMNNLATAYGKLDRKTDAMMLLERGIAVGPNYAPLYLTRGNMLLDRKKYDDAIVSYNHALKLQPDLVEAHYNLGNALMGKDQYTAAIESLRRAVELNPKHQKAWNNLGNACKDAGLTRQGLEAYRKALEVQPDASETWSNYFLTEFYDPALDQKELVATLAQWNRTQCVPRLQRDRLPPRDRDPNRRLRIGYVSGDFRNHVVMFFVLPTLMNHDHKAFEIFCYANVDAPDAVSEKVKSHIDRWRDIHKLTDAQAAQLVRDDRIDILVDLAGHTGMNRLMIFAYKPAPIQVNHLGYPGSTGMQAIDYRLTDHYADPPGLTEWLTTEKFFYLPNIVMPYMPPENTPDVAELPADRRNGQITFGCFNAPAKINEPLVSWWARILAGTPGSRIIIKNRGLADAAVRDRLMGWFNTNGIAPERVELISFIPTNAAHLALYNELDVALDAFPYHGATTTCETLWMGVPMVTLGGTMHVSRVGVSMLSGIGLKELVANTPEEYISIAIALAQDLPRMRALRAGMRQRMRNSVLMDGAGFARDIEAAFREMWKRWCAAG